jgi:hypothetical protein
MDPSQPGLDQDFSQNRTLELGARPHDQRKILLDLRKPGEVSAQGHELRCTPKLVDRTVQRHRADARFKLVDVGGNIAGSNLGGRHCIPSKQIPPVQEIQEVAVSSGKVALSDRLEMAGTAAAFEAPGRLAGSHPCLPVGLGPELDWQRSDGHLSSAGIAPRRHGASPMRP